MRVSAFLLLLFMCVGAIPRAVAAPPRDDDRVHSSDMKAAEAAIASVLDKKPGDRSIRESDGAAQGLYLLYAAKPDDAGLEKLQKGLRDLLAATPNATDLPERLVILGAQFIPAERQLWEPAAKKLESRNLLFTIARSCQAVNVGQVQQARDLLLAADKKAVFSLAELQGLVALRGLLEARGATAAESGAITWRLYERAQCLSLPFTGRLLFAVRQTFEFYYVDEETQLALVDLRLRVVESLLQTRGLLAEANIGLGHWYVLKAEAARSHAGLVDDEKKALTKRLDDHEAAINALKQANGAWLTFRIDPAFYTKCGEVLDRGQLVVIPVTTATTPPPTSTAPAAHYSPRTSPPRDTP